MKSDQPSTVINAIPNHVQGLIAGLTHRGNSHGHGISTTPMTTLHGVYVPTDVIDLVLDCLDNGETKSYLSNLSLVSQAWYELAFPCLHRMVMIRNIAHFEMLVSRVELETANNSLRISHHLRDLRFVVQGWHWDNCQSLMERFQLVIRKLVNLGHLKWAGCSDLIPIPTLESFGRRPQLRRLTISLANLGGISGTVTFEITPTYPLIYLFSTLTRRFL